MPTLDCPRALTEPPTCTGKHQMGWLRFNVAVDRDVNAVDIDCTEQTCPCALTPEEWRALEDEAMQRYEEGPDEDGDW